MSRIATKFGRLRRTISNRARRGVAAVEFALTMPIWITLLLGASDAAYCMLINERVDRIAYSVTDIVTQYQTITVANLNDIVQAASQLMEPFSFGSKGVVIVTSVYKAAGKNPTICWQYTGGGTSNKGSQIGSIGGVPTLPNGLVLNDNDNVIISEVYYDFSPMFISENLMTSNTIYRTAVYKPRLSPLTNTPS
ncbi:MAG TPA: TadE/TadG family type IV pilus assembly protein [Alphaproteobacteria bacterium]|nr:TadE/TadG family type IV pilus assembly protein [Alphaproteobacteria bacterium]